jgi:hypothetical protein
MKTFTNYFVGASLALLLFSCGSKPEEQLYGTWKHTEVEITKEDGTELDGSMAEAKDELIAGILAKNTTYEFAEGEEFGNYKLTATSGDKSGDFQAVELDGKIQIVLYDGSDKSASPTKVSVDEITADKMTTSFSSDGMTMKYTYSKQ